MKYPNTPNTQIPNAALLFANRATEICEFCLRHGGKAFDGWAVTTAFAYVFFHVVAQTVFVIRKSGQVSAVAFAWPQSEQEIRKRAAAGQSPFRWRIMPEDADALFLSEVIGRRELLGRIAQLVLQRWPDAMKRKVFTFRKKQLVELRPTVIAKLIGN